MAGKFKFNSVQLFKTEQLGAGSYGLVCKAKCDQLLCAAKLIYQVLLTSTQTEPAARGKEHRQPVRRFEAECDFLRMISHPNIVQYLGTSRDPETNALVLLMELMDESLTHFLESSPEDIPYHTQVNISYDIAQALAFLHANGIIHRDLSSNNVLLLGNRAKVTDFGMSKFDANSVATMTTCPGTPAFMSPEALSEPPTYTEKLDSFSLGVLVIQIATRKFPNPTERFKTITITNPENPGDTNFQVLRSVREVDRRQEHINLIEPTNPLLPVALGCIENKEFERPTSQKVCALLESLKSSEKYAESTKPAGPKANGEQTEQKKDQILEGVKRLLNEQRDLVQVREKQIQNMYKQLNEKTQQFNDTETQLQAKEKKLKEKDEQLITLATENAKLSSKLEKTLQANQLLQEKQSKINNSPLLARKKSQAPTIISSEAAVINKTTTPAANGKPSRGLPIRMAWESLPEAPIEMSVGSSALADGRAFFRPRDVNFIYTFDMNSRIWLKLSPPESLEKFTIVSVENILTTVGGSQNSEAIRELYSYENRQWVEMYPPILTARQTPGAFCTDSHLVVAGGQSSYGSQLHTVDILNLQTKRWSTACPLPLPSNQPSMCFCDNTIYLHTSSGAQALASPLSDLTKSTAANVKVWRRIAPLPMLSSSVRYTTLTAVNGHLLAVGGRDSEGFVSNQVYEYHLSENSWTALSSMSQERFKCLTSVLPGNRLMVVGGNGATSRKSVEITTVY